MRANGWRGNVRQARKIRTTVANPAAERFPDLVRRQFKAEAPGRLLVADFTYLALAGGGFAYVAFGMPRGFRTAHPIGWMSGKVK